MKYSKEGKGWGQGDSVWACDSKFGNCTDFHSLFISPARAARSPRSSRWAFRFHPSVATASSAATTAGPGSCRTARVGSCRHLRGEPLPEMRDYYFGNLTEDRVQFTTGRDIDLTPRQDGPARTSSSTRMSRWAARRTPPTRCSVLSPIRICKPLELNHRGKGFLLASVVRFIFPHESAFSSNSSFTSDLAAARGLREVRVIPRSPTGRTQALSAIASGFDRHSSDARNQTRVVTHR